MKAVLHVITSLDEGGAEGVLYRLCTHDQAATHVVLSLMDTGKYGPLLEQRGIEVICLAMPKGRITLKGLRQLWRLLAQRQFDVIQTWLYHADLIGGLCAKLQGHPHIVWNIRNSTLQAGSSSAVTRLLVKLNALLSRWVPHHIISCSQQATQVHVGQGYAKNKFQLIPNGFDLDLFVRSQEQRDTLRHAWGLTPADFLFGMVGRFDPQKNHALLLRSFTEVRKNHPAAKLVLVGRGLDAANADLMHQVQSLGLESAVTLLGPRTDVHHIMSAIDVHVLSSSYGEAFPNVLAEAMACQTPCIATHVGDSASIVGATGWIVEPQDPMALSQAMQDAIVAFGEQLSWLQRQSSCRARVQTEYALTTMIQRYHQVWFQS